MRKSSLSKIIKFDVFQQYEQRVEEGLVVEKKVKVYNL